MVKVYHFDINGTILGTDSTDNASIEDTASEAFSRSINVKGEIYKEGEQTYYNSIKSTFINYKSKVYNFVEDFPEHRDKYNDLVEAFKQGLFKSFLKLVDREFSNNQSMLVLRTFGKDREFVTSMLEKYGMKFVVHESDELNDKLYKDCHARGVHIMVTDSYDRWNENGRKLEFGKKIRYFEGFEQYAFDDNLCMYCDEGVKFYHVNTVRAALEDDYYINILIERV